MTMRSFTPLKAILALSLVSLLHLPPLAHAEDSILEYSGKDYVEENMPFARTPEPAASESHTLFPFGPASPAEGYTGPKFQLGYEIKASSPSDLTVPAAKAIVENDLATGGPVTPDTISVTGYGDWPSASTYSIAAVVVFPTDRFALKSLTYSAWNWTKNESYNEKLRHRWVVQTGGKYYVNARFLGRTGGLPEGKGFAEIRNELGSSLADQWVEYDPSTSIFADLDAPPIRLGPALEEVTAVGFYIDCRDFTGSGPTNQWKLALLKFAAGGTLNP